MALFGALFLKSRDVQSLCCAMTTWDNSSDSALFARRIKHELEQLIREQEDALESGSFLTRTRQQEEEFQARRRRITQLTQQLAIFERAQ
jgi:hypothetical protein